MSVQGYSTAPSRNLIRAAQGMLEHAQPIIVLGDFGEQKEMPKNNTDTLVFRRVLPFGAVTTGTGINNTQFIGTPGSNTGLVPNTFVLSEGATPNSNTISFQDVTVQLQNYGVLYKFSSKVENLYEDDIPTEMTKLVGETMGEILEMVRYGILKAGTQVIYTNGSSRAAVNTPISLNKVRMAARVLEANRARRVTQKLSPSVNFDTRAVQPAYLVFVHTDAEADVRNLPNFSRVEQYGNAKMVHEREIGCVEQFRFVTSPLLLPFAGQGSAVLNGMVSISAGTNVDIYPFLVVAESAWGQVALKGMGAITPRMIRSGDISHANPLGMFGYVGASTWFNAVRLNDAWMARIESGVTNL